MLVGSNNVPELKKMSSKIIHLLLNYHADEEIEQAIISSDARQLSSTSVLNNWDALMYAVTLHRTNIVSSLVKHGADVNTQCCNSWYPLTRACLYGYTDLFRFLLRSGANDDAKLQAFRLACITPESYPFVRLLYKHGFDTAGTRASSIPCPALRKEMEDLLNERKNFVQCLASRSCPLSAFAAVHEEGIMRKIFSYLV